MTRWVLLKHTLADGSAHLDWMLEVEGAAGLVSFRLPCEADLAGSTPFSAERIGDHRREYLEYEGPVSGDRGGVVRVMAGTCKVEQLPAVFRVDLIELGRRWEGGQVADSPGHWTFRLASPA